MATTYTTTFDLAEARTGVSGHYPLKVLDSDYTPDNTIYAKVGDKVKFVVSEPSPDSGNVSYNNTNVADTDPDPDEFTDDGTTNQTSPSSWEYTITSAAEDSTFQWWYFGNTFYNPSDTTQGRKYSQRLIINRVQGAPRINGGTSAVTVQQGGTITFSVTGLSGLLSAGTSTLKNHLYFSVFNSSNQWVTTTGASGLSWAGSNNQLGKVKVGSTSTVLTVGSSMPTGTYNVYLTHYNAADTPSGNNFMGNVNRLGPDGSSHGASATALQFTVTAAGTNTDPDLGPDQSAGTNLSQVFQVNTGAITCNPTTFEPSVSTSNTAGAANAQFRLKNANGTYPTTAYTTAGNSLLLTSGQSVDFKMTGPAGYNGTTTGRLTIGSEFDDLSITTGADPGGGQTGTGGGTTGDWGLIIKNTAGNQIFGTGQKQGNLIASGSLNGGSNIAAFTNSNPVSLPVAAADNVSSKVGIIIVDTYGGANAAYPAWAVYRAYPGDAGDTFRAYNATNQARSANYIVIRY